MELDPDIIVMHLVLSLKLGVTPYAPPCNTSTCPHSRMRPITTLDIRALAKP
jgi:hypothetical protein